MKTCSRCLSNVHYW